MVDAVVNTIGFPLVGGPAGSMEGGRQIEAAKEILSRKNVPYVVAAPLLIQGPHPRRRSSIMFDDLIFDDGSVVHVLNFI